MTNVIDLYSGNAFEEGADGYLIKAGQGELEYDWRSHATRAVTRGKPYGLFWVIDARYSPEAHKAAIRAAFPAGYFGELGFWLDIEKPLLGMTDAEYLRLPYRGYRTVESVWRGIGAYTAFPGFYFSPGTWDLIMHDTPAALAAEFASKSPLWIAHHYATAPSMRGAWREWQLWQWRGEPDYNHVNPIWWESVSRETLPEAYVIQRDRSQISIELTTALTDILPYHTPEEHAALMGAQAAINFGAGFRETDADHARVFGRSISHGIQYSENGTTPETSWGYIVIDAGTVIPFARRMLDQGAMNPDLDTIYRAPWTMLGFDARFVYLIVTRGNEELRTGKTQREAAEWARALGITQLYLGDSGHSSWILEYAQLLYTAYGERTPQAVGLKIRPSGGTMKARNAGTIELNIKVAATGIIKARMRQNDYVFGELSTAGTDIVNFDHFYRADGSRFELDGLLCKVTRSPAMVITNESEPGTPPPPPPPPPASAIAHMRQELTIQQPDGSYKTYVFEADGTEQ